MRRMHTAIIAGSAVLLAAGAAVAATGKTHTMEVALPDGSTAHIEYVGEVAPKVTVEPAARRTAARFDPFADLDRMSAAMQARHDDMLRQMAAMRQGAARAGSAAQGQQPGQLVASGSMPAGSQFTMVQSSTDANGCTRTVRVTSDGSSEQPQKVETSSGSCDKVERQDSAPTVAPAPAKPRKFVPGSV